MIVSDILPDLEEFLGDGDQDFVFRRLNQAVELLTNASNHDYNIGTVDICSVDTNSITFTLPREVEAVLAANVNGMPTMARNQWYQFHLNGSGSDRQVPWAWDDAGYVCTFQDLMSPSRLLAFAQLSSDRGAVIEVYGRDQLGNKIRSQQPDGTWRDCYFFKAVIATDFPSGMPIDDTTSIFLRNFTPFDFDAFTIISGLFTEGQQILITSISGNPLGFSTNQSYFVGNINAGSISLYNSAAEALSDANRINLATTNASSIFNLIDQRGFSVQTALVSATPFNAVGGSELTIAADTLPIGAIANQVYYAGLLSATQITVHNTASDAENLINAIDFESTGVNVVASVLQPAQPITKLVFSTPHNMIQGDAVTIANTADSFPVPLLPNIVYYVRVIDTLNITLHSTANDAANNIDPIVITTSGTGTTTINKQIPCSVTTGDLNNILASNHNLGSGDQVEFTTTGSYPNGISAGTFYQATTPLSANTFTLGDLTLRSIGTFTRARTSSVSTISCSVNHGLVTGNVVDIENMGDATFNANQVTITAVNATDFTYANAGNNVGTTSDTTGNVIFNRVNITSQGSGQLILQIARSFTVGFTNFVNTDATLITNGTQIRFAAQTSDGSVATLTTTTPAINTTTTYYAKYVDDNQILVYTDSALTTQVVFNALGNGLMFLSLNRAVTVTVRSSLLNASNTQYLQPQQPLTLTTNGILPAPFLPGTTYYFGSVVSATEFTLTDVSGNVITPTSVGSGQHDFNATAQIKPLVPTSVKCLNNEYNTGDQVTVYTQGNGDLFTPLIAGVNYYLRKIDSTSVEIYDTELNAENLSSTVGRILLTSVSADVVQFVQFIQSPLFYKLEKIRKPVTQGRIDLIGFDYARQLGGPTLLGKFESDETEPQYRRIKVGQKCPVLRIRFMRKSFTIRTVNDWLPFTSVMPILSMIKALDFFAKNFIDQYKVYKAEAIKMLDEEQSSKEGEGQVLFQFDEDVFTDPKSAMLDTGRPWQYY